MALREAMCADRALRRPTLKAKTHRHPLRSTSSKQCRPRREACAHHFARLAANLIRRTPDHFSPWRRSRADDHDRRAQTFLAFWSGSSIVRSARGPTGHESARDAAGRNGVSKRRQGRMRRGDRRPSPGITQPVPAREGDPPWAVRHRWVAQDTATGSPCHRDRLRPGARV